MPAIIAGKRRGAKLLVPEGMGVRPTLVRVREALFSILTSEFGSLDGLNVLDPFAGAGMLGLEAWSRGAAHVDFFELNKVHYQILGKNIAALRAGSEVTAILGQTPKDWHKIAGKHYDLVLCDPPYHEGLMPQTLSALHENHLLKPSSIVTVELNAADTLDIPEHFDLLKERTYGKCKICILAPHSEQKTDA